MSRAATHVLNIALAEAERVEADVDDNMIASVPDGVLLPDLRCGARRSGTVALCEQLAAR